MNKLEIIDETIEYYRTHKRAVRINGYCEYWTTDGRTCAVGRCCQDPPGIHLIAQSRDDTGVSDTWFDDELLKPEYRGHSVLFWTDLQRLHDVGEFWAETETGHELTERGHHYVQLMKEAACRSMISRTT